MNKIYHLFLFGTISMLMTGCAKEFDTGFSVAAPENESMAEYINSFDVLKSYGNGMKIGAAVKGSVLTAHNTPATQVVTNFDEVTLTDVLSHAATVNVMGETDSIIAQDAVKAAKDAGLSLFGPSLCSPLTTQNEYMRKVTADTYVPGGPTEGDFNVVDFEDMALGTKIEGSGGSTGVIVEDPKGESGHVYEYKGVFNHPIFDITLPDGLTLGNLTMGSCDFLIHSTGWVPASVLKVWVNGVQIGGDLGTAATKQGCEKGVWGRQKYHFDFGKLELNDEQKTATSFRLAIGDVCNNPDYFIDNITFHAKYQKPGYYVERPIEEKREDALMALDSYLKSVISNYGDDINTWIVASDALASGDETSVLRNSKIDADKNHYYWNEFLGDNFVAEVADHARKINPNLKFFYSDNDLDNDPVKLANCVKMLKQWNEAGAQLSGINAEIHLKYNPSTADSYKDSFTDMLSQLAATGLQVRLSGMDIQAVDDNGTAVDPNTLSDDDFKAMAELYKYVVTQYRTVVPQSQRYGISLSGYNASGNRIGLWNSAFNRLITYAGLAEGLLGE